MQEEQNCSSCFFCCFMQENGPFASKDKRNLLFCRYNNCKLKYTLNLWCEAHELRGALWVYPKGVNSLQERRSGGGDVSFLMNDTAEQMPRELLIGNKSSSQTIRVDEICYAECSGHKITLSVQKMRIEYYGRIHDLEMLLQPGFFRIHKGYLVNMDYVRRYSRNGVYMEDGSRLNISKYRYRNFVETYTQYIAEKSRQNAEH